MSVRIHQLSKEIGIENKELIQLLLERGFEVKSASSTIDNISADSLREEFAQKKTASEQKAAAFEVAQATKPQLPIGALVKSAQDVSNERAEKLKAKAPSNPAPVVNRTVPAAPKAPVMVSKTPIGSVAAPAGPPKAPAGPPKAPVGPPVVPAPSHQVSNEKASTVDSELTKSAETLELKDSVVPEGDSDAATVELKKIHVKPPIVVRDFAGEMGVKPFKLISELMEMGIFASMNQTIEEAVAQKIAQSHGFELAVHHRGEAQAVAQAIKKPAKVDDDDPRFLKPRPPVVCILGHVDHGKTTLLDTIRQSNSAAGEAGGITQHIGAYQIEHNGQKISFIDTPGHAAFSLMRERGANITDIAVLVVAADDAFKPQTEEALKFANEANNAIVVAINKIDAKGANVDRVKQQMQEKGIAPEDWGGETIAVEVSALKGTNIEDLLDMILLQAEVLELQANPTCPASGIVIESQVQVGRGPSASVMVERGTLKVGDALLCGEVYCKVKSLTDANGKSLKSAPPATPVNVIGWSDIPDSGKRFSHQKNEKAAKRAAADALQQRKLDAAAAKEEAQRNQGAATVEDLFAAIENQQKKCLKIIVKSDMHGSTEALINALKTIESDKVDLDIIGKGVGMITKNDITLASTGGAAVIGFNVRLDNGVQSLAKHHEVRIVQHSIIYELIDQVEECMADLLDAEIVEKKLGATEIRQVFSLGKGRSVAGCMVTEGLIKRGATARVMRAGTCVHESKIDTLKRFKDDVKEVRAGYECGLHVAGFDAYEEGDMVECFSVEEVRPTL
jgi:translation initiation factor IF-2